MINAVSIENAHFYGDILPSQYRLRHHGFKERQNYNVPSYKGMEFDAYDTPATVYLVWRDENNVARGCARLVPTTLPYMIEEIWPRAVETGPLPKRADVWEASRMCIDRSLPVHIRRRVHGEIICALQEFCLSNGIDWMIGVMTLPIWRSVFINVGWPIEFLGPPLELAPRERILAGKMKVSKQILEGLRRKFLIEDAVIDASLESVSTTIKDKIYA